MSIEATVNIDTRELADDGTFCDIVGDIAADVIRDSGEVEHIVTSTIENDIGYHISTYLEDNPVLDPDDDAFINAVAKAMLNMARSYVGE
mgnify:CR=1 FL=1|tara:strand:+ start:1330 stop:1599 length:270 start_codon:yes stop_codon:yes gene_type:complete